MKGDNQRLSPNRRQRPDDPSACPDCGDTKSPGAKRCRRCYLLNRPPPSKSVDKTVDGVRSIILALGERIADIEDLEALGRISWALWKAEQTGVANLRRDGYTDEQIGEIYGSTKQNIQKQFQRGGCR
ncbi:hypothetical protein BH23ACT10_BH23ACT10_10770 [soil metagenome]